MRVAIYIRVSTKLQEDRYSLSSQKLELTRYALEQKWTIVDIFKDVDSGGKLHKVGLEALLDCVDEGKVDVVLCVDQDRLSRLDTIEWEYLKQALRENNVKIAEPGNVTDLSNEDDEFISDIKNLIAKREKRSIVRRMMRGLRQYTREGKVWGKQPDEYHYDVNTKELTINEEYAWIIPRIDQLYLEEQMGLHRIAEYLNSVVKTSSNRKWTAVQVRNKLINPCYHGILRREFPNETIEVEGVYPPLRTKETFERIQATLQKRHMVYPSSDFHFLRNISIKCADCNHILSVRKGSTHGDSSKYYLKHAVEYVNNKCSANPSINTDRIKRPLIAALQDILKSEETAQKYFQTEYNEEDVHLIEKEVKHLKKKLLDTNSKLDNLLDLYLDGTWSKEKLDERKLSFEQEIKGLQEQLKNRENKLKLIREQRLNYNTVIQYFVIIKDMDRLLDEGDKQRLLGALFPTATYRPQTNELILHAIVNGKITLDITIAIDDKDVIYEERLVETYRKRYNETQQLLSENKWITFKELTRISPYNAKTLRKDEQLFGPYQYLMPAKGSKELAEYKRQRIVEYIDLNGKKSITRIAKDLGYSRKTVSELLNML
ncbi:recombinase family protein [Rummeliibacillus stabekisii]|uniref:Recombinase family protein n=1 Tax=Rummeliibacillus stabekisii TaxID=241244 RepID=A0A143HC70_9BACL|nr:recombinase family protein [Rummeliibacillus stabekisii]AMW99338.1 hypothetical protein ATY39_07585 [Rummeliibacillus stabekisii]